MAPNNAKLAWAMVQMLVIFGLQGYLQELVMKHTFQSSYALFVTMVQYGSMTLFALVQSQFGSVITADPAGHAAPFGHYALLALIQGCSAGLTNSALQTLSYPTKVLFKSAKPVPVMFYSVLLLHKRYELVDYGCMALVIGGLVVFMVAEASLKAANASGDKPNLDPIGVGLISLALLFDGALGPVQERCLNKFKCRKAQMLCYTYAGAFVIACVSCILSGDGQAALKFLFQAAAEGGIMKPVQMIFQIMFLSFVGFSGVSVVLNLVKEFGAVVAIVSATTRKAFTIGLSMLIFPKPVVAAHFYGMALFFMGLSISGWLNHTRKAASNEGEKAPRGSKASPKRRAQNPMAELERHTSSQGGDGQGGAMIWARPRSRSQAQLLEMEGGLSWDGENHSSTGTSSAAPHSPRSVHP